MLQLRVYGPAGAMTDVAARLRDMPGARHVFRIAGEDASAAIVSADLVDDAVDGALSELNGPEIPHQDVVLVRLDSIDPSAAQRPLASVVWADLLAQASANARPFARYLTFMVAAGVVAAFGVIYEETTLIVCGLTTACLVGGILTLVLNHLDLLPAGFDVGKGGFLASLSTVNISTPLVALAAGVAGILPLETRASSAVGVAISVTTIPASAYLGVAAGVGETSKAAGALRVLGINVVMLLTGGCVTLLTQRRLARRRSADAAKGVPSARAPAEAGSGRARVRRSI